MIGRRNWRWTTEEEAVLMAFYPVSGGKGVIRELKARGYQRTISQIRQKIYTTQFGRRNVMRRERHWHPDEYAILLKHFDEPSTVLQQEHGLKRSGLAIRAMKYRIRRRDKLC